MLDCGAFSNYLLVSARKNALEDPLNAFADSGGQLRQVQRMIGAVVVTDEFSFLEQVVGVSPELTPLTILKLKYLA